MRAVRPRSGSPDGGQNGAAKRARLDQLANNLSSEEVQERLLEALSDIETAGSFAACGRADVAVPALSVAGMGAVALPLTAQQAPALIACAQQAPYGRGMDTVVDEEVRRAWQVDAAQVELGAEWEESLYAIVDMACPQLGIFQDETPVEARYA